MLGEKGVRKRGEKGVGIVGSNYHCVIYTLYMGRSVPLLNKGKLSIGSLHKTWYLTFLCGYREMNIIPCLIIRNNSIKKRKILYFYRPLVKTLYCF